MKLDVKRVFHPVSPLMATAKGVAVLLSYLVGAYLTGHFHVESRWMGSMLAVISAIVVLQEDVKTSIHQGGLRVFGTFIGAVIAYVYLLLFPFTLLGMIVTVFLLDILCMLLGIPDDGKMATITLVIILLISKMSPSISPFVNGVLRFSEATVGALIGIALAWVWSRSGKGRIIDPFPGLGACHPFLFRV